MTQPFKLGDIAIIRMKNDPANGKECTIIGNLKVRMVNLFGMPAPVKAECYRVAFDGKEFAALPKFLAHRPPTGRGDLDRVVAWKDCPWQPRGMQP